MVTESEDDLYEEAVRVLEEEASYTVTSLDYLASTYKFERSWVRQKFKEILSNKLKED